MQEVDLPLWKHGEGGKDPKDFGFRFRADDVWHDIQVLTAIFLSIFEFPPYLLQKYIFNAA